MPKLRTFHENSRPYGGATFVDATGICNGRDVNYYQSLSAKTGVHIVASTGFVGGDTALPFFERASVEYLTDQFVHEITVGIGDTGGKAGIIKVGVSRGFRMKELDLRIYRAAARAALRTGVPIFTHLAVDVEPAIAIFAEEGLPLDRVLFGHADDGVSQGKVRDTLDRRPGRPHRLRHLRLRPRAAGPAVLGPSARRSASTTSCAIVRGGHVDSVLASADANCSPLGWPGVKGHTVNYLFEVAHPRPARRRASTTPRSPGSSSSNPADFLTIQN